MQQFLIFITLIAFMACGESKSTHNNAPEKNTDLYTTKTLQSPLSTDSIQWLATVVNQVHIDLYNYNATLTLKKNKGAEDAVYFISPDAVDIKVSNCSPFASIIYTGKGEILYEAEIFMDGRCSFIQLKKADNIVHQNRVTQGAFTFFSNVLEKYKKKKKSD